MYIRRYYTQPFHCAPARVCPIDCVSTAAFSMASYKLVMQRSLVEYQGIYPTCHLYFPGIHTRLKARVYFEKKIQVTRGVSMV